MANGRLINIQILNSNTRSNLELISLDFLSGGCRSSSECPSNLACFNGKCGDPCQVNNPCRKNEECQVKDHTTNCVSSKSSQTGNVCRDCVSPCSHSVVRRFKVDSTSVNESVHCMIRIISLITIIT